MAKTTFEKYWQTDGFCRLSRENKAQAWAISNIYEEMPYFLSDAFYWSQQAQTFLAKLQNSSKNFILLVAPPGSGKTALLVEAYAKLKGDYVNCWFIHSRKFGDYTSTVASELKIFALNHMRDIKPTERNLILVDTPYHAKPKKNILRDDLKAINNLWIQAKDWNATLVFSISENWLSDTSILNKTSEFRLNPFQPSEFLSAYRNIWQGSEPFTDEALLRLAQLSSGIFRKFMRLISICIEANQATGKEALITLEFVDKTILHERLVEVLDIEFSLLFKGKKKNQALKIMEIINASQNKLNQRQIAKKAGNSEASVSRIINKLIDNNHLENTVGPHGQSLITLKSNKH